MDDLNIQAGVAVNAEQAERAFDNLGNKAQKMANEVTKAADKAGKATDGMGDGAEKGAEKFTRAESRMRAAIQKSTRELEMLGKTASQKFEAQLEFKGLDKAKFQPFLAELRKTEEAAAKAQAGVSGIGDAAKVAGSMMAAAFSGAALLGVVGKVVSVQREFDVLNSSLKTVTGSSAAAEREMAWLKDFAKETPFGLAQATQGFVKMKALGLDPTRAALTSFGNTASAMGKDLNQMIEAVADASTGEFERLKEFGIKAKKEGDNVSLTFQGVTTTIRNSAADITKYLEDIGNTSFGGAMEERAKTLDGTIAALGDTWDELFRTVSTNNVGGLIFDSVTLANGALEDATTILRALGGAAQDAGRDTGALSTIQSGIATVFETVAVLGANLKFVLVGIGNEIGGLAAQVAQAAQFNFSGVAAIRRAMVADAEAARKEIDATTARILNARKAQEEYARYATRNASAATDPRRVDLGGSAPRATSGVSSGTAKAVKETISEYDKLIKKLSDELPRAAAEAEAAQMGYNKSQTEFLALAGSDVWAKFSNSQRATVAALFENKIASEQAGDAAKTLAKANLEAAQSREKYIASLATGLDKIQADIAAQIEATQRMGLSKEAIAALDAAKLEMLATDLELQAIKAMDRNLDEQTYDALKKQAQAYRDLAKAKQDGAAKETMVDMAKDAAEEWKRTADSINQSLTDALMRGFESGKDFAKNLRDTVINMFNTMVLRPVISAIVNPVAGAVTGMMGLSGAQGGGNSVMGGIQTASNLNTLYGAGSQALFGGAAGASAASLGYANIVGMAGGDAIGALAAANGMWAGVATGAQAAAQAAIASNAAMAAGTAAALPAGTTAAAAGAGAGAGGASGALASIPGWGWALAGVAALGMLAKKFDDSGTYHTGGAAQYSAATGLRTSLGFRDNEEGLPSYNPNDNIDNQFGTGFGYVERGDQAISAVSGIAQALGTALDGVAVSFGQTAGYEIATAFADDTSKDGAWGALRISKDGRELLNWQDTRTSRWAPKEFGDGEGGYKEYLAAVAKDTRQVLLDMDLPSWADTMLESIGEAANMEQLSATLQQIGVIQTTFVQLGKTMEGFAGLTDKAFEALMRASGGLESLAANAGTYYENFYSEAEKTANVTRSVSDALAQVGLAMPTTREEFRALVESQIALGDSGTQAVAALLGVSGAFASVVPAAEVLSEAMKRLQSDTAGLQIDLLRAQGNTTGADAAQRTLDTAGLAAAEVAVYDYNQALRAQISALDAAATAAAQQAEIRAGFERQLLELTGDTAAIRQLEIAGMNAANVALYDRVQALQAEAEQAALRADLERQLLELTGDTAAIRQLEIAGMNEANIALYDRVQALQAEQARAQERYGLETQLLQLLPNGEAALRARAIEQIDPANRALQELIDTLQDVESAAQRTQQAWIDWGTAAALGATHLGDTSGLQARDAIVRAQISASRDPSERLAKLQELIGIEQAIGQAQQKARQDEAKALGLRQQALQQEISQAQDLLRAAKSLGDYVRSLRLSEASGLSDFDRRDALQGEYSRLMGKARSGDAEALSQLQSVSGSYLGLSQTLATSGADYSVLAGRVAAELEAVAKAQELVAQSGITAREAEIAQMTQQSELLSAQVELSDATKALITKSMTDQADVWERESSQALELLDKQAASVDALLIMPDKFGKVLGPLVAGAASNAASRIEAALAGLNGSASGGTVPRYAVGTNYVPRAHLAIVDEGEAIIPKAFNPWAGGQGLQGSNADLVAEVRALREQNARLESRLEAIAQSTGQMAEQFDNVSAGGNALAVEARP